MTYHFVYNRVFNKRDIPHVSRGCATEEEMIKLAKDYIEYRTKQIETMDKRYHLKCEKLWYINTDEPVSSMWHSVRPIKED